MRAAFAVAGMAALSLLVACTPGHHAKSTTQSVTSRSSTAAATRTVSFRGVQVSIPAAWPVVDAAHLSPTCASPFDGQSDKAFVGATAQIVLLGCTPRPASKKVAAVDGVLMTPIEQPTSRGGTPTTLPGGEQVDLLTARNQTYVEFVFHQVQIEIGIGADPRVEHSILDSIVYRPGRRDTSVLGPCPASTVSPAMPGPARATKTIDLVDNVRALWPPPAGVQSAISASIAWRAAQRGLGSYAMLGGAASPRWSLTFGLVANRSARQPVHGTPAWLVQAAPAHTDEGYCGSLVMVLINAATGAVIESGGGSA